MGLTHRHPVWMTASPLPSFHQTARRSCKLSVRWASASSLRVSWSRPANLNNAQPAQLPSPTWSPPARPTTAYNDSEHFESLPDPQVGQQQWWLDDLRISGLDDLTVDPATPKVRVAVIDSGIDDTNPDLAGLVADRAPWAEAPGAGQSPHGTHVAGIIAAIANNGTEGRGIARNVEFLDINNTTGLSVAEMIDWATDHGADVINMSFCEVGSSGKLPCRDTPSGATIGALAWGGARGGAHVRLGGQLWSRCRLRIERQSKAAMRQCPQSGDLPGRVRARGSRSPRTARMARSLVSRHRTTTWMCLHREATSCPPLLGARQDR